MNQYLTVKNACELAHVSRRTIGRWMTSRLIRFVTTGHGIRIDAASLQEFLDLRTKTGARCNININVNISIDLKSLRSAFTLLKEAVQS